ncbi:hypothetical protein TSOC111612_01575 [Tsukamurella ocularis]|uniref:hypothetical protein n=1 Tax=Tsukamurella ocularis TaxID=1970234 RepID=UPI0039EFECD6
MNPQPPQYPSGYPPPQPPKKATSPWVWIGLIVLVLALLLGACVGLGSMVSDSKVKVESTVATFGAAPTSDKAVASGVPTTPRVAARCEEVPSGTLGFLGAVLGNEGLSLAMPQQVTAPNGDRYVAGHIMRGAERVSSSDVWLVRSDVTYALTTDARKYSGLADGRRIGGGADRTMTGAVSAGDAYGEAVQACVLAATQAANGVRPR